MDYVLPEFNICKCVCGKGYVKEKEEQFVIDCNICTEFYEFDEDGTFTHKTFDIKVGKVFYYSTLDHVKTFVVLNAHILSFYYYSIKNLDIHKYKISIEGIKK